jgi:MFS family permease
MDHRDAGVRAAPSSSGFSGQAPSLAYLVWCLFAGHTMAAMAMLVLPAVAPEVARDYGVDPSVIGYQISLVGAGFVVSLLYFGNFSRRFGAARTNQLGQTALAAGLAMMMLPQPVFLVIGSIALGLGHGLLGPSVTTLLIRFTPAARRNFVFSIQQTSVPLGGIAAALLAPALAVTLDWRLALAINAVLHLAVVAFLQRGRGHWDGDRDPRARAVSSNPLAACAMIWRHPRLRLVSVAAGCLCWGQFCVAAYTVVASVEALGMSLIAAGMVLTVVQLSNAASRVVAGWLADRVGSTPRVLLWIAALMLATSVASIWLAPGWPTPVLYLYFALQGIATGAWAGLVLAEVGHLAPQGQVSTAVSGALVYINSGKLVGPAAFAALYWLTTSYGLAFASVAAPALLAVYCLARVVRQTEISGIAQASEQNPST